MACECEATDNRAVALGACLIAFTVKSKCEQVEVEDGDKEGEHFVGRGEPGGERERPPERDVEFEAALAALAPPLKFCVVTYTVENDAVSNGSITQLVVGDDEFTFAAPIAPGKADTAKVSMPKPADCSKERIGKIRMTCPGGGGATVNRLEVCRLT
jgi:hypothetical protein